MGRFSPRFTTTHRVGDALGRIERARGFLEAATLSERWISDMGRRALILEAHHTTHIEGTQLTLEQAERALAGAEVPEARRITMPDHTLRIARLKMLFVAAKILSHGNRDEVRYSIHEQRSAGLIDFLDYLDRRRKEVRAAA